MKEISINFRPDAGLMYLIQQVTKQPTDEILGFFYDFGKAIAETGFTKMEGRSIRKDIQDLYPGTAIPFKILVKGQKSRIWDAKAGKYKTDEGYSATLEVCFPDNPTYMDTTKMMDIIVEKELLGGSSLPDFEKPKNRANKMYKALIDQVLGKRDGQTV